MILMSTQYWEMEWFMPTYSNSIRNLETSFFHANVLTYCEKSGNGFDKYCIVYRLSLTTFFFYFFSNWQFNCFQTKDWKWFLRNMINIFWQEKYSIANRLVTHKIKKFGTYALHFMTIFLKEQSVRGYERS